MSRWTPKEFKEKVDIMVCSAFDTVEKLMWEKDKVKLRFSMMPACRAFNNVAWLKEILNEYKSLHGELEAAKAELEAMRKSNGI